VVDGPGPRTVGGSGSGPGRGGRVGGGGSCGGVLPGPASADAGRLYRTWRAGRARHAGYLEDYADVAHGLYELHVATGELRWLQESRRLALLAVELFSDDERGGFYLTAADAERLVARTKSLDDNPTPSGNSMLAFVLLRRGARPAGAKGPGRRPARGVRRRALRLPGPSSRGAGLQLHRRRSPRPSPSRSRSPAAATSRRRIGRCSTARRPRRSGSSRR